MSFWLGRFPPLADELLVSWIIRLARQSGLSPYAFAKLVLGSYWIWCRDTELSLGQKEREILSAATGIPAEVLASHAFLGSVPEPLRAVTHGMLSCGVYHRTRRRHGLQYCPACLFEGDTPYYRREWRFALQFGCTKHAVRLLDACPHCDAPLMPHRRHDGGLTVCSECSRSLASMSQPLTDIEWEACAAIHRAFHEGSACVGTSTVLLCELVAATHCLFAFVTSRRMPAGFADEFDGTGSAPPIQKRRFESLTTSRIRMRAWAIPLCLSMLDVWNRSFIETCRAFAVNRIQILDPRHKGVPEWFAMTVGSLPHKPYLPRRRRRRRLGKKKQSYKDAFSKIEFGRYLGADASGPRRRANR